MRSLTLGIVLHLLLLTVGGDAVAQSRSVLVRHSRRTADQIGLPGLRVAAHSGSPSVCCSTRSAQPSDTVPIARDQTVKECGYQVASPCGCDNAPTCGCDRVPTCGCDRVPTCGCDGTSCGRGRCPTCGPCGCCRPLLPMIAGDLKMFFRSLLPCCRCCDRPVGCDGCDGCDSCCDMAPTCGCDHGMMVPVDPFRDDDPGPPPIPSATNPEQENRPRHHQIKAPVIHIDQGDRQARYRGQQYIGLGERARTEVWGDYLAPVRK